MKRLDTSACTHAQCTKQSKGLLIVITVISMNGCKLMESTREHLHTEVWNMWTVKWNTALITLQEHNNIVITSEKGAPHNNIQKNILKRLLQFFFFCQCHHVPYGLSAVPSKLWPKCNRLLRLGHPWGAVMLSWWCGERYTNMKYQEGP
jgi:hypothetical protein